MAPCRKHQKVEKQDKDGLPHHNDAMTSALSRLFGASCTCGAIPRLTFGKCFYIYTYIVSSIQFVFMEHEGLSLVIYCFVLS